MFIRRKKMEKLMFSLNKKSFKRAITILFVPLIALSVVTQLYLLLPVAHTLNDFLGTESSLTGLLTSGFGICYALGFLVWGQLSDRLGRCRVMTFGLVALAAVTAMIALQKDFYSILALRCIQGFIASSFPPVVLAWVTENFTAKVRSLLVSMLSCSFLLASTIGQKYGSFMINGTLEKAMLTICLIYCAGAILFFILRENEDWTRKNIKKASSVFSLRTSLAILMDKSLVRIYFSSFLVLMSFIALYYILIIQENITESLSVDLLRDVATLGMLSSLSSGPLLQRIKPTVILATALLFIAVTVMLQVAMISAEGQLMTEIIVITHFIFSCAVSISVPTMIHCFSIYTEQATRGQAISLYTCVLFVGASIGSFIPGVVNPIYFFMTLTFFLIVAAFSIYRMKG